MQKMSGVLSGGIRSGGPAGGTGQGGVGVRVDVNEELKL